MDCLHGLGIESELTANDGDPQAFGRYGREFGSSSGRCFATQHGALAELSMLRKLELLFQFRLPWQRGL